MSDSHTSTPWSLLEEDVNAIDIVDDDGDRIASIVDDSDEISTRTRADAAFIVRAVNAHDDLIAALTGMLHEWDKVSRYGSPLAKSANERVNFAREALAKAEAQS